MERGEGGEGGEELGRANFERRVCGGRLGNGGDGCRTVLVRIERECVCVFKIFVKRHWHGASCGGDSKYGGWDSLKS